MLSLPKPAVQILYGLFCLFVPLYFDVSPDELLRVNGQEKVEHKETTSSKISSCMCVSSVLLCVSTPTLEIPEEFYTRMLNAQVGMHNVGYALTYRCFRIELDTTSHCILCVFVSVTVLRTLFGSFSLC